MIENSELSWYIHSCRKINRVAMIFGCSTHNIRKYISKYNLKTPKGFYASGVVCGRPKGIPMSHEQKLLFSKMFEGKNNPMFDKKHDKVTKKKMSKNHADFSGDKNPFKISLKDEDNLEAHKNRCRILWGNRSGEWKQNFSEKLSKSMAMSKKFDMTNINKQHESGRINTKKAGRIFVRSSWERIFAEFLDSLEVVEKFSLEKFCVPYYIDDAKRYSRIDFLVNFNNGLIVMFEIKPKNLLKYGSNLHKIRGYKKYCEVHNIFFCLLTDRILFHEDKLKQLIAKISRSK